MDHIDATSTMCEENHELQVEPRQGRSRQHEIGEKDHIELWLARCCPNWRNEHTNNFPTIYIYIAQCLLVLRVVFERNETRKKHPDMIMALWSLCGTENGRGYCTWVVVIEQAKWAG